MKRNAQDMIDKFRAVVASQSEDEIANFLEDINDSIPDVDMSEYISTKDYERVVEERDAAVSKANDYRDRYINRFYHPGNGVNDLTLIEGAAPQKELEQAEEEFSYDDLFE